MIFRIGKSKNKKEINAYYEMLRSILELNDPNAKGATTIDLVTFLDKFHKLWKKYHSKEFKHKQKGENIGG